jgi:hypothetical protein
MRADIGDSLLNVLDVEIVNVMDVELGDATREINDCLLRGQIEREGLASFPTAG